MGFVKIASTRDLKSREMKSIETGGREIVMTNLDGKFYAIGNRCTHMGCMLSDGSVKDGNVRCPCHGSIFDFKTGNVVKGPAKKPEPVFQLKVEGDQVFVDI